MNDFRKKTGSGNKHNFKTGPEKGKFGKNFVPEQRTEKKTDRLDGFRKIQETGERILKIKIKNPPP